MTADKNRFTTTCIPKGTLQKLKGLSRKLRYPSVQTLLRDLAVAIDRANYSRLDVECLMTYGKIPKIIEGSARNEKDFEEKRAKLGSPAMRKTSEFFVEKVGKLSKDMLGKEDEGKKP